jgi:two-component system cell cycle response regulator DivK
MRVLVVESSGTLRRVFSEEIAHAGYSTVAVSCCEEALRLARDGSRPDVILLDATLDPAHAVEFVGTLRADPALRGIPVAAIAFAPGSERGMLEAGAKCCLRTVPGPGEVLKAVEWAFDVYGQPPRDPGST